MPKKRWIGLLVLLLVTNIGTVIYFTLINDREIIIDEESDQERPILLEDTAAVIGDKEITNKEWLANLRRTNGQAVLEEMINQEVVSQLAEAESISIRDKVMERELAFLAKMQGVMTEEELKVQQERLRADVQYRLRLQALLTRDGEIPEEELQQYYHEFGDQYDFSASVQLSHILVENRQTAEKVVEELDMGADFSLLAREYSVDEETKDDGGYMGFIYTSSQFLPESYEEKTTEMEEHSYSEAFQAENGFAVIYLHRELPEIKFTYEEIKPYMESELLMKEKGIHLDAKQLWNELDIEWRYGEPKTADQTS